MQIQNNKSNLNFSGLGIVGKVKSEDLPALNTFMSSPLVQTNIKMLEQKYNTDVFVLPKVTLLTFKHRQHGYLTKYDMPKFSTSDFMYRVEKVVDACQQALSKVENEQEKHMQWLDSIISESKKPA